MSERRAAALAAELTKQGGELAPPWARYPWIPRGSIGWRMGVGESYMMLWGDFLEERGFDLDGMVAYLQRHGKAPRSWMSSVAWLLDECAEEEEADSDSEAEDDDELDDDDDELDDDDDDDDDDEDGDDEDGDDEDEIEVRWSVFAEERGLIGDDVSYGMFVKNALADGGMKAPWAMRGASDPESTMRYSPRELGWWARWLHELDLAAREAHLAAQPPPPAWRDVVEEVRRRWADGAPPPVWRTLTEGARALIPAMVVHGELPPPWLGDHPPFAEIEWEEDSDDRHRWAWWVFETFEDRASWDAYLRRWPPPAAWKHALDEVSFPYLLS